ncbi:MAG: DUF4340 domain-containing protein [Bacteroidota bacterium]
MFKRFTNKQLLIFLGGLGLVYLVSLTFGGRAERTFEKTISALDTTLVNTILVQQAGQAPVTLNRQGGDWMVSLPNGQAGRTSPGIVKAALGNFALLEASQVMSTSEDDWTAYKVDTAGTRLQLKSGQEVLLDIMLGESVFKQTGGMTYVRLNDDETTYLAEGYLSTTFNKTVNEWRDNTFLKGSTNDWAMVNFAYAADSSFRLVKDTTNAWIIADGSPADPAEITNFLAGISNLTGTEFVDRSPATPTPDMQLAIQTATQGLIEIKAYPDAQHGYLLASSLNPGTYFSGQAGDLVGQIFVGKNRFAPKPEE